jgi:hypothetical protein
VLAYLKQSLAAIIEAFERNSQAFGCVDGPLAPALTTQGVDIERRMPLVCFEQIKGMAHGAYRRVKTAPDFP